MKCFTRGDVDGFFGLFIDNLVQMILIMGLSLYVLGMKREPGFLVGTVMPGVALSVIVGNLFYGWQAIRLARKEGRDDVTALPYGINTVSLFAYVFLVMLPVYIETGDFRAAWRVGLAACFFSGVIEFAGAFVARYVRKFIPRAALLSTLAGIAISFIALDFANRIFAFPLVALLPLVLIFMQYFGRVRFAFGLPGGLLSVTTGTLLYWLLGYGDSAALSAAFREFSLSLNVPRFCGGEVFSSLDMGLKYIGIIVPMGLFNLIGSLQNLESAEAGGDAFDEKSSLMVNGIGSMLASLLGSPYPTTIYIGHPGWKSLGARAGYSVLNGIVIQGLVLFGFTSLIAVLIPIEAGAPIILWIGMIIFVQAFGAVEKTHYPAVIMGLIPSIGALAWLILSSALVVAGTNYALVTDWSQFAYAHRAAGFIALERGFIVSSMLWATLTVFIIERRFLRASLMSLILALCAWIGIIHTSRIDSHGQLFHGFLNTQLYQAQWQYALAYAIIAAFFLYAHVRQRRQAEG
ncbi:MAG TPA: NCS2 family permease [Kiritimatiellia bacterium]|nr:NCS2 family permease [Kiritimatiellia bacterium]HPS06425.1 NCS2 family permease [Kiritimatiellia bacterium]